MKTNFDQGGKENKDSTALETLLLGRHEIEELLSMSEVLRVVENAFELKA